MPLLTPVVGIRRVIPPVGEVTPAAVMAEAERSMEAALPMPAVADPTAVAAEGTIAK